MSSTNVSYESFAPRSTAQVSKLSKIAALTAPRGMSASKDAVSASEPSYSFISQAMSIPSFAAAEEEEKDDAKQSTTQAATPTGDEVSANTCWEVALTRGDELTQSIKHTVSLRLAVRASINIAEDLSASHAALIRHSGELTAAADRLSDEAKALEEHAEELGRPLQHYNAVDQLGPVVGVLFKGPTQVVRGLAKIKVDDEEEFMEVLDTIDKAVAYFERESGGKEALQAWQKQNNQRRGGAAPLLSGNLEYYRRSLALQDSSLYLIQAAVADRIKTTTEQITATMLSQQASSGRGSSRNVVVPADQLEASLIYTRFHGISSRSQRLLSIVQARLHKSEAYYELWQTCLATYCQCREILLRETVRAHLDNLHQQHGPVGMTRLASVFLTRLCTVETNLYHDFFSNVDSSDKDGKANLPTPDSQFTNYMINLCSNLHRTVRRSLVTLLDLDTLCQVVSVLREEGQQATRQAVTLPAGRAMAHLMEDAQERVIFCAHSTLQKQVIRFKATPKDLDYPDKLMKKEEAKVELSVEEQLEQVYESWFPPVRAVLRILSKIFRVVEAKVFEDMALQSVQACSKALFDGAKFIERRRGVRHSDLFLVKHLLILREQLSPFDIELRSVERQLDFSDAGKAVARFLTNRNRRIFSMSTENALVTLLREGVSVQESSVDSKRDLEDALRKACNDFIDHTVQAVAAALLDLHERLKNTETGSLAQLALLQPASVDKVVGVTSEKVESGMAEVLEQMGLYLENPATQSILLKPVSRKIIKASEELRRWVSKCEDGDNDWDDEKRSDILQKFDALEQSVKKFSKPARS
uniref:Conserved oligomeric Golgi complex subunit 3 C-terminal domain-containing protein n=1 Tax=Amphora coffeiformis TaxID=265554 RepID=A0A7S3LH73_9STRA